MALHMPRASCCSLTFKFAIALLCILPVQCSITSNQMPSQEARALWEMERKFVTPRIGASQFPTGFMTFSLVFGLPLMFLIVVCCFHNTKANAALLQADGREIRSPAGTPLLATDSASTVRPLVASPYSSVPREGPLLTSTMQKMARVAQMSWPGLKSKLALFLGCCVFSSAILGFNEMLVIDAYLAPLAVTVDEYQRAHTAKAKCVKVGAKKTFLDAEVAALVVCCNQTLESELLRPGYMKDKDLYKAMGEYQKLLKVMDAQVKGLKVMSKDPHNFPLVPEENTTQAGISEDTLKEINALMFAKSNPFLEICYEMLHTAASVFAAFCAAWVLFAALIRTAQNHLAGRIVILARTQFVKRIHAMYMIGGSRAYYTLTNLDSSVENPSARITVDVDLMFHYLVEFFIGGIFAAEESGVLLNFAWVASAIGIHCPRCYMKAVAAKHSGLGVLMYTLLPVWGFMFFGSVYVLGVWLSKAKVLLAQAKVQKFEAAFRSRHMRSSAMSESICFYGGEKDELEKIDQEADSLLSAWAELIRARPALDFAQLFLMLGYQNMCKVIDLSVSGTERPGTYYTHIQMPVKGFMMAVKCTLDFAKAEAMVNRVLPLIEVMEEFEAMRSPSLPDQGSNQNDVMIDVCCFPRKLYPVPTLPMHDILEMERTSRNIEFNAVNVYTPDGCRLLVRKMDLTLQEQESCLIMGPSGIGKSSLLRVLGDLWPLFRSPGDDKVSLRRPGARCVFFLPQKPYLCGGTLKDQVAYPFWDESLQNGLDDATMERLFMEVGLAEVWEAQKHRLDSPDVAWEDVLSLGEKQRLQFARLFWHQEWVNNCKTSDASQSARSRPSQVEMVSMTKTQSESPPSSFFAVLDEATASMDTFSEMTVYEACRARSFGFLSVAHRPTVIQFHSKVLRFSFDTNRKLGYAVQPAADVAHQAAQDVQADVSDDGRQVPQQDMDQRSSQLPLHISPTASASPVTTPYSAEPYEVPGSYLRNVKTMFEICKAIPKEVQLAILFGFLTGATLVFNTQLGMALIWNKTDDTTKPSAMFYRNIGRHIFTSKTGQLQSDIFLNFMFVLAPIFCRVLANRYSVEGMVALRKSVLRALHTLYFDPKGRLYYALCNLDGRISASDQRVCVDADMGLQLVLEFVVGGILKPDTGLLSFGTGCLFGAFFGIIRMYKPGMLFAITMVTLFFILWPVVFSLLLCIFQNLVSRKQVLVQSSEAVLRTAHQRCSLYAESICFYGGAKSELQSMDNAYQQVETRSYDYVNWKTSLDAIIVTFKMVVVPIAWLTSTYTKLGTPDLYPVPIAFDHLVYYFTLMGVCRIQFLFTSLAKGMASLERVADLWDVMKIILEAEVLERKNPTSGYRVHPELTDHIELRNIDIYTPSADRLLLRGINLDLAADESCLIMGPSGIGKSSLLRVLGELWPLFRFPGERGQSVVFKRPGHFQTFFIAQRPYLVDGSLRDQVAYPIWKLNSNRQVGEEGEAQYPDDAAMAKLFKEAGLDDVWRNWSSEADKVLPWSDKLSLGEQQRLQFARLFWHHDLHRLSASKKGFFAILDEATASIDVETEQAMYRACAERKINCLSVAHRPTVIQYHSKVLQIYFDEADGKLRHKLRSGKEMASEAGALMTKFLRDK